MQQQSTRDADFGIQVDPALITLTRVVYILQALGYLTLISYVAAVVVNYVKIDEVKGTWLESHFLWQIRTFWYSLLWSLLGAVTFFLIIGYFILIANTIWVIYRIIKGWLRLEDNKPMYQD